MKKICLSLLACALVAAAFGCDDTNNKPYITVLKTSGDCGVAPFPVEFYAIASGGDELDDPTGANIKLDISWDFGDGTGTSGSALVYHTYADPGEYEATVTVEDADGDRDHRSELIHVRADTMTVWAVSDPADTVVTGEPVQFDVFAESCSFDPYEGSYGRFIFRWRIDTTPAVTFDGRSPTYAFPAAQAGDHRVTVSVEDPRLSVVRHDTLDLVVRTP